MILIYLNEFWYVDIVWGVKYFLYVYPIVLATFLKKIIQTIYPGNFLLYFEGSQLSKYFVLDSFFFFIVLFI